MIRMKISDILLSAMKKGIHPEYKKLIVTCSCGNKIETGSTLGIDDTTVDICSKCHPFYTGEQKIVDTDNLVKKYEERKEKSEAMSFRSKKAKMEARKSKRSKVDEKKTPSLTLKDMLENANISK